VIKLDIGLKNEKVWPQSRDRYPPMQEPIDWLAERGCFYILSQSGMERADAVGYSGYKYGSNDKLRTIPSTFFICYSIDTDFGHYIFDDFDVDLAMLFKLVWC
jgi:hypothetical protein